ncbi:MAG: carboxypeptidase-like regulatory domain-containing protein [Planctomycetota bacterium]
MRGEQKLVAGVVIFGLLALATALVLLLRHEPPDGRADALGTVGLEGPESEGPLEDLEGEEAASRTRVALEPVPLATELETGPPPSYRKSLGRVVGRVIEESGAPLPGIQVEAFSINASVLLPSGSMFDFDLSQLDFVSARSTTTEEGRFELTGLEPRAMHLLGFDLGRSRATVRLLDQAPSPGELVDVGDIMLGPYVTFVGRVIDAAAAPIPGARVRVTDLPAIVFTTGIQDYRTGDSVLVREAGMREVFQIPGFIANLESKLPVPTTFTDENGDYRIEGVPIGLVTVVVDCEGYLTTHQGPIASGRSGEKVIDPIVLGTGETLRGVVMDTAGRPVAGAEVMAGNRLAMADVAILHPCGTTNEQGRFEARALRSGVAYAAARRAAGEGWVVSEAAQVGSEEVVLTLPASFELIVRVAGSQGEKVANADLRLAKGGIFGDAPTFFQPPVPLAGRLRSEGPGVYVIERLAPGPYKLRARAAGFGMREVDVSVSEAGQSVDVTLDRQQDAAVQVVDAASGEAVEYARVSAWPRDTIPLVTPETSSARTDARGEARLQGLKTGTYKLMVSHPAYAVAGVEMVLPGEAARVELVSGGVLEGRVHRGGEPPLELMFLFLEPRGSREVEAEIPRTTVSDLEGHFRIANLDPGSYHVQFFDRVINKGTMSLFEILQNGPIRAENVEIVAGETSTLDVNLLAEEAVEGQAAYVKGYVLVNGLPAPDYRVVHSGSRRRGVSTDAQGFFDLGRVPAGHGVLRVNGPSDTATMFTFAGNLAQRELELQAGEVRQETIELSIGSLRGYVTHAADGTPAVGAIVELVPVDNRQYRARLHGATDTQGEFYFAVVPEGEFQVSVRETGYSHAQVRVKVSYGLEGPPVLLKLQVEAPVAGRLLVPELPKEEVRWVWLRFRTESGEDVGEAEVNNGTLEFTVEGLDPGTYQTEVRINGERYRSGPVVIPPGGTRNLRIECALPSGRVKGRIILPESAGNPRGLMLVFHQADDQEAVAWSRVDAKTLEYDVKGIEPGTYRAMCYGDGKELGPVEVIIPEGGAENLVIRFGE